ncbi:uroporphyrinogen-III synthase [Sphingomonas sp. AR_OL41]|uniref:uroporphyrinogen-III synthase n=1 Tax=Sphingomonas sp. AR_OL41 TaxID=3042729 RepID=UPI00248143EE|nr:uroporphyrinogen-III synthase [Sphingomonas sp. AR_OL41]MDH7972929.1 uroporphyrinogen-III synthase [Sphingomonas sp. AR_OL41]
MSRRIAVLRPEPGNAATVARVEASGAQAISLQLFVVRALDWISPDAGDFDAILLTSANAVRHGGSGLALLTQLPAFAVGEKTAAAARAGGFDVRASGESDVSAIVAAAHAQGYRRLLHLGGRDRASAVGGPIDTAIAVYASEAREIDHADLAPLAGAVALLHSARAARRLGELIDSAGMARAEIAVAAISTAVAEAAGSGWSVVTVAAMPRDEALIEAARALID